MRRRIFKYSKLDYFFLSYIIELIILLLVNLFLKKASRIVQLYIHISKKGINISLHINLNVLMKFMILCQATPIAVLGRMRPAGHRLDSPPLVDSSSFLNGLQDGRRTTEDLSSQIRIIFKTGANLGLVDCDKLRECKKRQDLVTKTGFRAAGFVT